MRLAVLAAASAGLPASQAQAHPHVWATIKTDLLYAADGSVTGVRHAWTFDDMFSAFATVGNQSQNQRPIHPRGIAAARQGQCRFAQGFCLLHLRHDGRSEGQGCVRRCDRLLARLRSQGDGADAALYAAVQEAGESEGAQDSKSTIRNSSSISPSPRKIRSSLSARRRRARSGPRSPTTRTFCRRRISTNRSLPPRPLSAWARRSPTTSWCNAHEESAQCPARLSGKSSPLC